MKRPRMQDFELPIELDPIGEKSYVAYKKAKKTYIQFRKQNPLKSV